MGEPERAAVTPKEPVEADSWRRPGMAATRGTRESRAETFIMSESSMILVVLCKESREVDENREMKAAVAGWEL